MTTEARENFKQTVVKSRGNVVFVLGTGVAMQCSDSAPQANWVGLLRDGLHFCGELDPALRGKWTEELLARLAKDGADGESQADELIVVADAITNTLRDHNAFNRWLWQSVGSIELADPAWVQAVQRLEVGIATTNYDDLIERAIRRDEYVTWKGSFSDFREALVGRTGAVMHLHGHFREPDSVVFGRGSYEEVTSDEVGQEMLRELALGKILVFLGYGAGLDDPNFRGLRLTFSRFQAGRGIPHYRLVLDRDVDEIARSHRDDDFVVVGYGRTYDDLPQFLESLVQPTRPAVAPAIASTIPRGAGEPLIGREETLARLLDLLATERDVALTGGLPGVGKTAIAMNAASLPASSERFPDGCLWVGLGQNPDLLALLMRWANALSVSPVHADQSDSAAKAIAFMQKQIQDALASRRVLLIIDDVWEISHGIAFRLGGPDCAHLFTTRLLDVGDELADGTQLPVEELPAADAFEMVRSLAPDAVAQRQNEISKMLPTLTGGLPIALRIVAKLLRRGEKRGSAFLDEVMQELAGTVQRLDLLDQPAQRAAQQGNSPMLSELFAMSERLLDEDAKEALRDLAVFPPKVNTFSLGAAKYASNSDLDHIGSLVGVGFIEPVRGGQGASRYQMHRAVADFVSRMNAGNRDTAFQRLREFYVDYLINDEPAGEGRQAWYDDIELDLRNIEAAIDDALKHGDSSNHALSLTAALGTFWYERARYSEGRLWNERVIRHAKSHHPLDDSGVLALAKVTNDLGNFAYNQGDITGAARYYFESLALRRSLPGKPDVAGSLNNVSLIERLRGNFARSRHLLATAIRINTTSLERGDDDRARLWLAINLNNLGLVALAESQLEQAHDLEMSALEHFRIRGNEWGVALVLSDLGYVLAAKGEIGDARRRLLNSLTISLRIRNNRIFASALRALALLDHQDGLHEECLSRFAWALTLSAELGDAGGAAESLWGMAAATANRDEVLSGLMADLGSEYTRSQGIVPGQVITWAANALSGAGRSPLRSTAATIGSGDNPRGDFLADARVVAVRHSEGVSKISSATMALLEEPQRSVDL